MKNLIYSAVFGAAFFMGGLTASATPICLPRSELAVHLAEKYGEMLIAQGLNNRGALVEIFATKSRDRWTLTETDTQGMSCLKATGDYWNSIGLRRTGAPTQPAAFNPMAVSPKRGAP
ncbi:hypothetical protein [Sneathiella litorea]|uniref:Uncharacterized protein n=1 Tax=Sneathiella litorea TaxID=2606216 RepID=A0A6L8W700_9PROT|nr:hypothetical protein [Sneathiella litorea]MZR30891.1 hypothetical protein [Sneathiella litorea]